MLLEVRRYALGDARVFGGNRLHREALREFVGVGFVDDGQVELGVEDVFDAGGAYLLDFDPLDGVIALDDGVAVDVFQLLFILGGDVHKHGDADVVFAEQGHEGGQVVRAAHGDDNPAGVEALVAVGGAHFAEHLQVDEVGRGVDHQAVGREEQGVGEVVSERHLQREDGFLVVAERVGAYHGAAVVHVLHGADAVEVIEVDHERRVGGIDDLVLGREALVDEAQEVGLR